MKIQTTLTFFLLAGLAAAEVTIPDGTKLRVRLDQSISSATAEEGQSVELSVTEAVKVNGQVVIADGARVTGTVTEAQEKRHMGRAGKLDFSIDRVRTMDGEWVPLRYTVTKKNGESHAVRTGVITAGAAVLFWPAAPAFLLMKGKDITLNKGMVFDTFTDRDHVLKIAGDARPVGAGVAAAPASGSASVAITSDLNGADIEIDGAFVGSTPTTITLPAGPHQVSVGNSAGRWQRNLMVNAGSTITLHAQIRQQAARASR
ncbi:MAG TPA: PEGA domain-containing protein [Bryobacteraceae bacterium]